MRVLLVYPLCPDTFWSFKHVLKFVSLEASNPPLGALTVAALLPEDWEKRLVDMNISPLTDDDIIWADYVFISAMAVQRHSAKEVIQRCKSLETKIVAGGPLFSSEPEEFPEVDHLVLNEAEVTLPLFLADLAKGTPQNIYSTAMHPDITLTPIPMWSLLNIKKYATMSIQYSRGCPHDCEFCYITVMDGHNPRTKNKDQILAELDSLLQAGWRGEVFFVDDNFIANKRKLKTEILPAIIHWMQRKNYPFNFHTEVTVDLGDDVELMDLMAEAGFSKVCIGIETPYEASLLECDKKHNIGRDLINTVKTIQRHGFETVGGFIVGFDSDPASIFQTQIDFIQRSGIVAAYVGLLNAPRGTRLYQRLKAECRLLKGDFSGDSTFTVNFTPKMNLQTLMDGYKQILNTIYSPKFFYERVDTMLREHHSKGRSWKLQTLRWKIQGFFNCVWFVGFREDGRRYFWRRVASALLTRPTSFPLLLTISTYGYHFRRVMASTSLSQTR